MVTCIGRGSSGLEKSYVESIGEARRIISYWAEAACEFTDGRPYGVWCRLGDGRPKHTPKYIFFARGPCQGGSQWRAAVPSRTAHGSGAYD